LKGLTVKTGEAVPDFKMKTVHVTVSNDDSRDCVVFEKANKVLMHDCEVFGGSDGLFIDNVVDFHIKECDIRFA